MYRLIISPQAKKELKKLKKRPKLAISLIVEEIKDDPYLGKLLTRELTGRFSFRVGTYRVIYKVYERDKTIFIFTAGHRATVYKNKTSKFLWMTFKNSTIGRFCFQKVKKRDIILLAWNE